MVTETKIDKVDKRKLTVLSVNEFIDNDDEPVSASTGRRDVIDVRSDSYILCFTGRRGGGKTTAMSFFGAKCMALWNMRVLSNYPIDFMLCREVNGVKRYYPRHSEPLDLYKLLCFDNDYKNCIICIDEAPDIISHMAASSWKNRLLAIFVRQLRKNNNSLMLCAQDFGLIDKSMRWQVDIEVQCVDAKKQYGNEKIRRGSIILMRWLDCSGMWTGKSWQQDIAENKAFHRYDPNAGATCTSHLYAQPLWGDKGHKAVFDTYYQQDIWESLRKVDMHLSSYSVGDKAKDGVVDKFPVSSKTLVAAMTYIDDVYAHIPGGNAQVRQKDFFRSLGALSDADKNNLGRHLSDFAIGRGGEGSERVYSFDGFDIEQFRDYVKAHAGEDVSV
jgi:hypothetical protein